MICLTVSPEIKKEVLAVLDRLPLPQRVGGKISVRFEFNVDHAGKVGDVYSEMSMRETLVRK
jgi:hypothetical protein